MSTVPTALAALVIAARRALPELTAQGRVFDGQWLTDPGGDAFVVGWSPDRLAVEATSTPEMVGERERYDIVCLACAAGGDTDAAAVRARAFAQVAALKADLARDPTMGRVVTRARISVLNLSQAQVTGSGADASVQLLVHVDAFGA